MRSLLFVGSLVWTLAFTPAGHGARSETPRAAIPEDLADAWERLQRALHDWGGQLRERFGSRDVREDRAVISQILSRKDHLRLSPEQVKKLEQLRDQYWRQSIRNDADTRILELDIGALLDQPKVDVAKVEAKIREVEKLRADLRIARVRAVEQAKAVLTAEQRNKLHEESRGAAPRSGQNSSATDRERSSP